MHTVAMRFVLMPLPDILVSVVSFPDPIAMFNAQGPFAIVTFAIVPSVQTFAVHFALAVVPQVLVAIAEPFVALAVASIADPAAFIYASVFINADSKAVSLLLYDFTSV
jgi:hypothetical protein